MGVAAAALAGCAAKILLRPVPVLDISRRLARGLVVARSRGTDFIALERYRSHHVADNNNDDGGGADPLRISLAEPRRGGDHPVLRAPDLPVAPGVLGDPHVFAVGRAEVVAGAWAQLH